MYIFYIFWFESNLGQVYIFFIVYIFLHLYMMMMKEAKGKPASTAGDDQKLPAGFFDDIIQGVIR